MRQTTVRRRYTVKLVMESARRAVRAASRRGSRFLRSTLKVLGKNGFSDLTIEEVADRAAVGKATVYRWWPNKGALIADAFASSTTRKLRFPDTGSLRKDMSRQMRQLVKGIFQPPRPHRFCHSGRRANRSGIDRSLSRALS